MNKEEIIKLAQEAGLIRAGENYTEPARWGISEITDFYSRVAAAEREACAKVCDEKVDAEYKTGKVDHHEMAWTQACAIAIRARGEQ
jgi:hypothetical protein